MGRSLLALGLVLLVQGSGCFFLPFDPDEEMVYGSPCLDVNILDGLDETDSAEIQDLFDCLNQGGTFDSLVPVVDEVVAGSDRNLEPLAYHAAAIVNTAPDLIPIWETLGATQQLLIEENEFLLDALHLVAEFVYGVPWPEVEELAAAGDLQNAELLADGPLGHLVPVLRIWAEVILDADDVEDSGEILDHLLSMPELRDTLVTLRELNRDNDTNHLFDDFSEYWGEFLLQTHDDVTGRNTLVDAVDALVSPVPEYEGQPLAIQTMLPHAEPMFADEVVRQRLVEGIGDLYDRGTLDDLPDQLFWLMTVDMHGNSLDPGEESAFESAMVLLDQADDEFVCDPLGLELVYIDSVSVWLLQEIVNYGIDAHTIEELVSFVEGMYDTVIEWVAFACDVPPILPTHFDAIIRLAESGALHTLIPLLNSLADPDVDAHNYLREFVDIVHLLVALDLIAPIEGLLAPTLGQHFMPAVLAGIGAFVDPSYDLAGGDVYTLLDVVIYLITPPEGDDLYERAPLIIAGRIVDGIIAGEPDELDAFIVTWGELLAHPDAVTHDIQYGIEGLLDLDPDLKSLDYVGDILNHEEVCTHWLLFFEDQGLMDALGMPGSAGGQEVPLAALGRLIADGTAEDLVLLLAWLNDLLAVLGIDL